VAGLDGPAAALSPFGAAAGQVAWLLAAAPFIKSRTWLRAPGAFEDGTLCYRDIGKMIELAICLSVRRRRAEGHDPERSQQPGKCRYTCFSHFESTFQRATRHCNILGRWASRHQVGLLLGRQRCAPRMLQGPIVRAGAANQIGTNPE
jgi:hypothetical protein